MRTKTTKFVTIPMREYQKYTRLKNQMAEYEDIRKAREDIKNGDVYSEQEVRRRLGLS